MFVALSEIIPNCFRAIVGAVALAPAASARIKAAWQRSLNSEKSFIKQRTRIAGEIKKKWNQRGERERESGATKYEEWRQSKGLPEV